MWLRSVQGGGATGQTLAVPGSFDPDRAVLPRLREACIALPGIVTDASCAVAPKTLVRQVRPED